MAGPGSIGSTPPPAVPTTTTSGASTPAATTTPTASTPAPAQTFTPQGPTGGAVQDAANPSTGFAGPVKTGQDFQAFVQASGVQKPDGSFDMSKYDSIATAFKGLSKSDKKAELKWLDGQHLFGLEQYCKQAGGGGGFWGSLGNALGEAMFGGNR